jgi:hypothetical protein
MSLLRQPILLLARSQGVKRLVSTMPVSSGIVTGYVPGETTDTAVAATQRLVDDGLRVTLDYLGEDTTDVAQADATVAAYKELLAELAAQGLAAHAEVSVKLSAIGQFLPDDGHKIALENARDICRAARNAGTTVTLDMEDHTTTDSTLTILRELRKDFPETGAVLQAMLHRTEADCRALAYEGSRVRLCKGAYMEPEDVAFQDRLEAQRPGLPDDRHPRPADGPDRLVPGQSLRAPPGHLRVPDALRHPPRGAAAPRRGRGDGAGLHPLRHRVVRLPHAPPGREAAEPGVLRALARLEEVSPRRLPPPSGQ